MRIIGKNELNEIVELELDSVHNQILELNTFKTDIDFESVERMVDRLHADDDVISLSYEELKSKIKVGVEC